MSSFPEVEECTKLLEKISSDKALAAALHGEPQKP